MKKNIILILCLSYLVLYASFSYCYPTAKATAKVVDELGEPISGSEVWISFMIPKTDGWGMETKQIRGNTDTEGLFTAEGEGVHSVSISARKDGYYYSGTGFDLKKRSLNRWEPWNPTIEIVLKKKRNPVPMYDNHRTSYKVPKFNEPIGFDLEKEDWVTPYGAGVISDFIINFYVVDRAYTDYECGFTLTFSNEKDGIQEYFFTKDDKSSFKWPFNAPVNGYQKKLSRERSMNPKTGYKSNAKEGVNYIFQVRTQTNEDGNIIEANYGKLINEFGFDPIGKITFRYILNPDKTKNLEYDKKKNLFKKK